MPSFTAATFDQLRKDTSFALRQLRRARSFSIAAIATLSIGIGATVAVFSLVEAVVLRPLPFANADRVVNPHPMRDGVLVPWSSNLEFATWRALPGVFDGVAAMIQGNAFTVLHGETPEVVTATRVSADFLHVFGVNPEVGRGFSTGDDQPGAAHVVMLSHVRWMKDYNGQRSAIGQYLQLDGESYSIIGVTPASLDVVNAPDALWVPLALSSTDLTDFRSRQLRLTGRLAPGITVEQASAAINASEIALSKQFPMWGKGFSGTVKPYTDDLIGNFRARLFILLGAVGFVFLIASVNVANLVLARATTRTQEMAVRAALGAERRRLIAQMLTESAVLSFVAGVVGILLAYALVSGLVAASPPGVPRIEQARVDGWALLVTIVVSLLCSIIVGLIPALRAASPRMQQALRDGARGSGESRARGLWRSALVATEVALAMTLLTGAGLLIKTAWAVNHVDAGFDSSHAMTAQILLPPKRYTTMPAGVQAYRAIRDNVAHITGVQSVALTSTLPLVVGIRAGVGAEGKPMTDGERLLASVNMISPEYFSTMKIRMRTGRDFSARDVGNSPLVAVINEALAKRLWPGESAIGKRMEAMDPSHQHFLEVVGVIPGLRDVSLDQAPTPEFYIPYEQAPARLWSGLQGSLVLVARTIGEPLSMERNIRKAIDAVDPSLPIAAVSTLDALVSASRATARFNTLLLSVLGAIALVLASVGVYGVIAYSVSQRTREIGLRMALGATPMAIVRLVVQRGLTPIGFGAVVGAGLSVMTTRLLRDQLYGVAPGDPMTIVSIAALLLLVSLVAALVPARRAVGVSPVIALAG
ncbi:MAG: ABC transporter permease [Gemmatimonadaceae bacterium]